MLKIEKKFELLKENEMSKIILDLFSNKEKFEKIGDQDPIGDEKGNIPRQTTIVNEVTDKVFVTFQMLRQPFPGLSTTISICVTTK